ncbi:MAG: hypothetical protein Q7R93_04210 [bacterium]|nr:hypothetical protein [bacterium]
MSEPYNEGVRTMSERSLGDVSHNRINQMLEALQASGFPVDLFHRLRLDGDYRKALVEQAILLDREIIGDEFLVDYDRDFDGSAMLLKALKKRSPYSGKQAYLLNDEILCRLCAADPAQRSVPQYPLKLYAMPSYKRMDYVGIREELKRRDLVLVGAVEALCLATRFCIKFGDSQVLVPGAVYEGKMLCFSRNGRGDPMLYLSNAEGSPDGIRLLVKRDPV